ncbi:hypothetical protein [Shewanella sp. Koi 1]
MQFDPHATKQSRVTTQILITHAIQRCPSQKTLALELSTPDSRISEWKNGKGQMPTNTALQLIEKFGSPSQAKGVFKSNCKILPKELSLQSFFNDISNLQASRLLAGYINSIRCIVIPNRSIRLEPTIEDYVISNMLEDDSFLMISRELLRNHATTKRHWNDSDEFLLGDAEIGHIISIQGEDLSILTLFKKFNLEYLLEDREYKYLISKMRPTSNEIITMLAYTSIVINDLKKLPNTILSTWLGGPSYLNLEEPSGGDVVLTGDLIHEWYDNNYIGIPVKSPEETDCSDDSKILLNHINQLWKWTRKFERSIEHHLANQVMQHPPLFDHHSKKVESLIFVKEIDVFHKTECSYLNIAITISMNQNINPEYRYREFTLILEYVTTYKLLDELIPLLGTIGLKLTMSELNTKYKLAKHGLLIPGAVSI